MKPLIILVSASFIALLIYKLVIAKIETAASARIGMTVMLIFTATSHFIYTKGMTMMIPTAIPFKTEIVYLSGVLEMLLGIGLLLPSYRFICGWSLIALFILLLPANIYAATKKNDFVNADNNGNGLLYLWFRAPLQALFILWTYFPTIKK